MKCNKKNVGWSSVYCPSKVTSVVYRSRMSVLKEKDISCLENGCVCNMYFICLGSILHFGPLVNVFKSEEMLSMVRVNLPSSLNQKCCTLMLPCSH